MKIEYRRLTEKEITTFIGMRIQQLREEGAKEEIDLVPALREYYMRHMADGTFVSWLACNGVQREHNKKLNNGLPILHKVPPKRDYGRYFCIMAEKGGTSHGA